ncbi:MAG TPA: sensor histidine kinase [Thermoanaerobaculia bacterium]|jgi:signal transduction histidine kinase|nr:sensor histidine kinase [Thermoanaerobaculia bacterium]
MPDGATRDLDSLLREKREEHRLQTARKLVALRIVAALVWCGYETAFGLFGGHQDFRENIPLVAFYVAASGALYVASRESTRVLRRSWLSLPLLDMPLIFAMQYRGTPLSVTPVGTAAFSIGILALVVAVSQLSMRTRNVIVTAVAGTILEIVLLARAGVRWYGWFAAVIVLSLIGFATAAAVEQSSALLREVVDERMRIAREVHDTLAQGLAGISIQLESVAANRESLPATGRMQLDRARMLARSSLAEARGAVWALRSERTSPDDLAQRLGELMHRLEIETTAAMRLKVSGTPRRLAAEAEAGLLRIAQEALRNAVGHAEAKLIEVELRFGSRGAALRVRDDGRGFDPAACVGPSQRFGLKGMEERAVEMRATLQVRSARGRGTEIEVIM